MKKAIVTVLIFMLFLTGCATTVGIDDGESVNRVANLGKTTVEGGIVMASDNSSSSSSSSSSSGSSSHSSSSSSSSSSSKNFTNKYGSSTTLCHHSGCNNYIASSGDTWDCSSHAGKCLNCKKYIDCDAMYCMSCLTSSTSKGSSSSSSSSNKVSGSGKGGYDMPKESESFSDYVKRVDPDLYSSLFN